MKRPLAFAVLAVVACSAPDLTRPDRPSLLPLGDPAARPSEVGNYVILEGDIRMPLAEWRQLSEVALK